MSKPTSLAQLRRVTQPPEVRLRANAEHWTASLYLRDLSPYVTWVLLRTPVSANGVTALMILTGWATAASLLIPGIWGPVVAVILGQLQMLIDCCDGEVARWQERYSPRGVFLDKIGHYTAESVIPIALGIRAAGWPATPLFDDGWGTSPWLLLGVLLALLVVYNKALNDVVHVSRAAAGLDRLADTPEVGVPQGGTLRRLRSATRFLPFQRAYHSVELTILAFLAAIVDAVLGDLTGTRVLLAALVLLAPLAIAGHIAAILTSRRLR